MDIEDKLDFKEFKKTIKQYKAREEEKVILNINVVLDLINKIDEQQAELEKKDKVINEMAEMINNHDIEEDVCKQMGKNRHCNDFIVSERNCINCIKEYFTNKAENVGE